MTTEISVSSNNDEFLPHAFHWNLPAPYHHDPETRVPYVTLVAHEKSRKVVESVHSIQLDDSVFASNSLDDNEESDDDDEGEDNVDPNASPQSNHPETLHSITKKCSRLLAQFSTVDNLKYSAVTQMELCGMILHLLELVTATRIWQDGRIRVVKAKVGVVRSTLDEPELFAESVASSPEELTSTLQRPFALPTPARESLLSVLISLLSNKGPLRSVSNSSIHFQEGKLLILDWRVQLHMLLRTAPYLDEHSTTMISSDSSSRQSVIIKRTVELIRDSRHFFEQANDLTASQIWNMVKNDALFHSHTHACYRATIILYLFHPSCCSTNYYKSVLPLWCESWTNIDRCPEYDFLWLALLCRARKFVAPDDFDWTFIRKRLLTNSQYWLQLPIGGTAFDKSFPRAMNPRSRSCPPRLKVFVGASSTYEEGIDFVAKVCKLLVTGLGTGPSVRGYSEGTSDVLTFLAYVVPYMNPSNLGSWTFTLGAFLHYFCYELCCRVGTAAGLATLKESNPDLAQYYQTKIQSGSSSHSLQAHEVVALLDALLPMCQQALYSKNGHVGRAGEAAMLYLVQIDPIHTCPAFADFATAALDIRAVNLSHQAPAALSALTRLVQPALRSSSVAWLIRLPEILRLSLAGIDSNDQNKTLRTLILYRSLTSWIPIIGIPKEWDMLKILPLASPCVNEKDGTMRLGIGLLENLKKQRCTSAYIEAIQKLPASSLLKQGWLAQEEVRSVAQDIVVTEAMSAMSDWAIEFLARVFELLRAQGEREKTGKNNSGVANRHSSADVHAARNFSRVLKETVLQLFASMSESVHEAAVRAVVLFLQEESHPAAAKDASFVCQAVAAAREDGLGHVVSPGLDALVEILTVDVSRISTKTLVYRLRCLAGAVRSAGSAVLGHRKAIVTILDIALNSQDRHVFKTGCKLLRHLLSSLSEAYPLCSDSKPRVFRDESGAFVLGRSAQLSGDPVKWHTPNQECMEFLNYLLESHLIQRLDSLCENTSGCKSRLLNSLDVQELRRFLRIARYCFRGCASVLLDSDNEHDDLQADPTRMVPYEMASRRLLAEVCSEITESIVSIRMRLASFIVVLSAVVASDTFYPDELLDLPDVSLYRRTVSLISSDRKVCKETCLVALLLLTRRGASFRSQEARTIWKAQKQLATDFPLSAQVDQLSEILQSAGLYGNGSRLLYKDGEDAGKSIPRRLLVGRVKLFHDALQRSASFDVPKRLRRANRTLPRKIVFNAKNGLSDMLCYFETLVATPVKHPLDAYEGIYDGLCALCCNSNTQVRASAIGVIDYAITRFGWLLLPRVPRMLQAISLKDESMNGKFGFPSCASLVDKLNNQTKRKRLAEAMKGICAILSLARSVKFLMGTERMRYQFAETMCGTDRLISLLPVEEVQKVVHYFHAVFSPYRSKIFYLPRLTKVDKESYANSLCFSINILLEKKIEGNGDIESVAVHWRKLLLGCWFLSSLVDSDERDERAQNEYNRVWATCFKVLEEESGQPLQRVGLGLLGRLAFLVRHNKHTINIQPLFERMKTDVFCTVLAEAIVFDHREDNSIGGGHDAQWSMGVEDIIRDAGRNLAPKTLFPFHRTSQSLGSFKVSHSQLVECILDVLGKDASIVSTVHLLNVSRKMAGAPPNEDQRNQQITSAEIFGGICSYFLKGSGNDNTDEVWHTMLLPHLEDVMIKIPFSLISAYFDAIRYALQFSAPRSYYPLTEWLVNKISLTLWQPTSTSNDDMEANRASLSSAVYGSEGFTSQSKWLCLVSAVLIEMDDSEVDGFMTRMPWYSSELMKGRLGLVTPTNEDLEVSWRLIIDRLLPRLTGALGHPFDSCRDHVSRCLFRVCYCYRKRSRRGASLAPGKPNGLGNLSNIDYKEKDPGSQIVATLATLTRNDSYTFDEKYNALSTARRFISHCVHLGEAKFEYSDYVIPLLPLTFEALTSTMDDVQLETGTSSDAESAVKRSLEADVIKAYRSMIAEVSVTAVICYGREADITRVLKTIELARQHETWQVRHACGNFLRCFQGAHKFLFTESHKSQTMTTIISLLADERREVSSAAIAALTGILSIFSAPEVDELVTQYSLLASRSKMRRDKKGNEKDSCVSVPKGDESQIIESKRMQNQQVSVFFLCAAVLSQPYETPAFVPKALAAISKHSFEKNAPLSVRDTVKRCCAEYKRTHMSDNWDFHRQMFSQEELEALEDVVSSPHYYA